MAFRRLCRALLIPGGAASSVVRASRWLPVIRGRFRLKQPSLVAYPARPSGPCVRNSKRHVKWPFVGYAERCSPLVMQPARPFGPRVRRAAIFFTTRPAALEVQPNHPGLALVAPIPPLAHWHDGRFVPYKPVGCLSTSLRVFRKQPSLVAHPAWPSMTSRSSRCVMPLA